MIDVADGANVHMRLAALKDSGVSADQLLLAPSVECALDGIDVQCAQSPRRAQESGSERHAHRQRAPMRGRLLVQRTMGRGGSS